MPPADHLLRTFGAVSYRSRVLDLGCGDGRHTLPLAQLGFDLYACDKEADCVAATRHALEPVLGAAEAMQRVTVARPGALGYPDAFLDWVVAYGVYPAGDRAVALAQLAETRRVLKPGGWVYLAVGMQGSPVEAKPYWRTLLEAADLARAEALTLIREGEHLLVRGIYRRVEAGTPV